MKIYIKNKSGKVIFTSDSAKGWVDVDLKGANLEGANLRGANLNDANLEGIKVDKKTRF